MDIKLIAADRDTIKRLREGSALTWEGVIIDEKSLGKLAKLFIKKKVADKHARELTGYTWHGREMNELYSLHGDNAYPDGLTFLAFDLDSFTDINRLCELKAALGARWLDDIVDNNAQRENG